MVWALRDRGCGGGAPDAYHVEPYIALVLLGRRRRGRASRRPHAEIDPSHVASPLVPSIVMFEDPIALLTRYAEVTTQEPQPRHAPPLVSKRDAAERLGVSGRTIQTYSRSGHLRAAPGGLRFGVLAEDVGRLEKEGVPRKRPSDCLHAALLADRAAGVEMRSQVIAEILDVRRESLEVSNEEIVALANRAATAALHGWEPGAERGWVELFLRLDDRHARRLARVGPWRNPWMPFLTLARAISSALRSADAQHVDQLADGPVFPSLARHAADRLHGEFSAWAVKKGDADRRLRAALAEFEATRTTAVPESSTPTS
jgi:hypothetical protein